MQALPLPIELVDEVLQLLDSRRDLLSLCLASKALCEIALGRHLQLRVIRIDPIAKTTLWKTLAVDKVLAASVLTLELGTIEARWRPERIPSWSHPVLKPGESRYMNVHDPPKISGSFQYPLGIQPWRKAYAEIIPALRNMSNLKEFLWCRLPCPKQSLQP